MAPRVAGSNPVAHPNIFFSLKSFSPGHLLVNLRLVAHSRSCDTGTFDDPAGYIILPIRVGAICSEAKASGVLESNCVGSVMM